MQAIYITSQSSSAFINPVDAATPTRLHSVRGVKACKQLIVKGLKSSRTNNVGTVYLGTSATNDAQQFDLSPGAEREFTAPEGSLIDPYDIYVDIVTAADGVWCYYGNTNI